MDWACLKTQGLWTWIRHVFWIYRFIFQYMRQNYANIGRQSICWTDFDIDIAGSNPKVSTCSNTLNDSFEGVMRLFEVSAPFNMCIFSKGRAFDWSRPCLLLCQMNPLAHAMPLSQYLLQYVFLLTYTQQMQSCKICSSKLHIIFLSNTVVFFKTTNHIVRIAPFEVGRFPLEKCCNLKNVRP